MLVTQNTAAQRQLQLLLTRQSPKLTLTQAQQDKPAHNNIAAGKQTASVSAR
jgi:hypothetical protein